MVSQAMIPRFNQFRIYTTMNTLAFIAPSGGELILVLLVLIMLFGAKDAPRILRKIQNVMDEIRRIANGFRYDMMYSDLHNDPEDDAIEADAWEKETQHENELSEDSVVEEDEDENPEKTDQ
jgi:Sec-independent protein translocase protein TatA